MTQLVKQARETALFHRNTVKFCISRTTLFDCLDCGTRCQYVKVHSSDSEG